MGRRGDYALEMLSKLTSSGIPRIFEWIEWLVVIAAIQYFGQVNGIWWLKALGIGLAWLLALHVGGAVGAISAKYFPSRLTRDRGVLGLLTAIPISVGIVYGMYKTIDALIAAKAPL